MLLSNVIFEFRTKTFSIIEFDFPFDAVVRHLLSRCVKIFNMSGYKTLHIVGLTTLPRERPAIIW